MAPKEKSLFIHLFLVQYGSFYGKFDHIEHSCEHVRERCPYCENIPKKQRTRPKNHQQTKKTTRGIHH